MSNEKRSEKYKRGRAQGSCVEKQTTDTRYLSKELIAFLCSASVRDDS